MKADPIYDPKARLQKKTHFMTPAAPGPSGPNPHPNGPLIPSPLHFSARTFCLSSSSVLSQEETFPDWELGEKEPSEQSSRLSSGDWIQEGESRETSSLAPAHGFTQHVTEASISVSQVWGLRWPRKQVITKMSYTFPKSHSAFQGFFCLFL